MKIINISKVILLSSILVFGGCKLKEPTENVQIKIDTDKLLPVNFSIQFVDQANGSVIADKEVKIEISGPGASKIYEISGTRTFKVANGMINLAIRKDAIPSESNPLNFTVTATAQGYLASTANLIYTDAESKSFDIQLVSLDNLPESITKTSVKVDNTSDGLASEVTITPTKVPTINTGMSVTIPAGTKFLDASGNALSGSFDAKVYYFSPESDALQYTPQNDENGEMTVKYKNNQSVKYVSIDAACAYIEISNSNGFVASFSKPISVSMDVHKDIMNIETNAQVKSGDSLEFITRNLTSTDWGFQKNTVVQDLGGANFTVVGQISNAYWVKASFGGQGRTLGKKAFPTCYGKFRFVQTSSTCLSTFRLENVSWVNSGGVNPVLGWTGPVLTSNVMLPSTSSGISYTVAIPGAIKILYNPRIRTRARNMRTGVINSTWTVTPSATSCTVVGGTFATAPALSYTLPAGQSCNPILLAVNISCPNISLTSIPPIFKKLAGSPATTPWTQLVVVPRGSQFPGQYFVHGLTIGSTYTFKTTYKNTLYTSDIAALGANMVYSLQVSPADCP
jgi:hypothetical protein